VTRLLIVGRTRYRLPLEPSLARKFDALRAVLELRVLASAPAGAPAGDDTFTLVPPFSPRALDGLAFQLGLPVRVARELRAFRPDAILTQSPHEAAACLLGRGLAHSQARVVVELHGDWRTATRLYGSRARRVLGPLVDRLGTAALRRADAVRTVSPYTTGLAREIGVEPAATFPAYMDLDPFLGGRSPLPAAPRALFVGVLERYKNIDGLAEAWRRVAVRVPEAQLRIVGDGSLRAVVEALRAEHPGTVRWDARLEPAEVAAALDGSTVLVLPSRSEGMGRVLIEAFCRGRGVVATRVGGIRDLVGDGESGLLVEPGSTQALADALVRVLSDAALATRLGEGAAAAAGAWLQTPEQYAERIRALVEAGTR
jgi:glycosyltransferase involved in cell wall biosynthesis